MEFGQVRTQMKHISFVAVSFIIIIHANALNNDRHYQSNSKSRSIQIDNCNLWVSTPSSLYYMYRINSRLIKAQTDALFLWMMAAMLQWETHDTCKYAIRWLKSKNFYMGRTTTYSTLAYSLKTIKFKASKMRLWLHTYSSFLISHVLLLSAFAQCTGATEVNWRSFSLGTTIVALTVYVYGSRRQVELWL